MKRRWTIITVLLVLLLGGGLAGIAGFLSGTSGNGFLPFPRQAGTQSGAQVPPQKPTLAVPERGATLALVNGTMQDFSRAVSQKDFTDFYAGVSTVWKKQTTIEKIAAAFKGFLPFGKELKQSVDAGPTLNAEPLINEKNILVVQGFYRIEATKMLFDLQYVDEASEWKLLGMDLEVK